MRLLIILVAVVILATVAFQAASGAVDSIHSQRAATIAAIDSI